MTFAIDGWFAIDHDGVRLIGTRCAGCGTICFPPRHGLCPDPRCGGTDLRELRLPGRGRVWSYTNACYPPPPPYVAAEPYEPVTLAAVELEEAGIVVLGQVEGLTVEDLEVGMELELTSGPLADGPQVWMWRRAS
ncbi:benzoylsuccinyl-CoA thiolase [Nonomuraea mesophila]|uniref:Benzoylsuccinyl-CoA thiolase n=1 Tax=Nonomuraea mesophila TaxID=2530382 RepID=A0A4R5FS30_9ACTN|nr:OB-fold domain-containing protein [Nonomuraea mesophila]TDE56001.1 benzoylsuccinyl-CoA thiolase [Nonomuraea mesophila]